MSDIKKKARGIRKENPDPDKKCVFPFMHGGKKYCKCTTVGTFGKLDGLDNSGVLQNWTTKHTT